MANSFKITHRDKGGDLTATVVARGAIVVKDENGNQTRRITPAYVESKGGPEQALTALYRRTSTDKFWWTAITPISL